ncbi:hypothetical protein [Actinoplanes sp. DH11]|uniref:hypothetical protein n=1 Tax=Actinoplanes sp. DH11 TaxID=2857011 RepID=UPI001E298B3B|nr:hypothetical protein [Actinoplanes sp. DH11]
MQVSDELLASLDDAWDEDEGFLGKLRAGVFDEIGGVAYVALLRSIPPIGETVESELVKLIWFAPQFVTWQIERATRGEAEAARLRRVADQIHEAVADVLGIP